MCSVFSGTGFLEEHSIVFCFSLTFSSFTAVSVTVSAEATELLVALSFGDDRGDDEGKLCGDDEGMICEDDEGKLCGDDEGLLCGDDEGLLMCYVEMMRASCVEMMKA